MIAFEAHFKEGVKDEKNEPLGMEYFYFPLGLWLGGLLLSAIILLAEIIIHRRGKSHQTDSDVDVGEAQ